ncbi:MAG: hypothetical protein LBD23_03220 [Oscillospiraceae bacterium]|nr:hypothetical protein [Oscillospiraceae bacterium]
MKLKVICVLIPYIVFTSISAMNVFFTLDSFLGINMGWGFILGGVAATFLFIYSITICSITFEKTKKQVGFIEKVYTDGDLFVTCSLIFIYEMGIGMLSYLLINENSFRVKTIVILILIAMIYILFSPLIHKKMRLLVINTFAIVYLDCTGVHSKNVIGNDYFLPWDECVDIGWAFTPRSFIIMYFSKKQLTEKELRDVRRNHFSNQFLYVYCVKGLVEDVLQYIDKDRIARFYSVDSNGKITGL